MAGDKIIGTMACWSCAREIPVKRKASGKLSAACPWCDMPHYANPGTEHEANLLADVKLTPAPAASSSEKQTTAPNDKQAPPAAEPDKKPAPPARSFASPLFGGR